MYLADVTALMIKMLLSVSIYDSVIFQDETAGAVPYLQGETAYAMSPSTLRHFPLS